MCSAEFEIRPPPPQEIQQFDFPPPRPPSPVAQQLSNSRTQSKESFTLTTLAGFKHTDKPLPELIPFPFKPDTSSDKPKNFGTVSKPSKFIKGTMYHSDYESDLEGPIPTKWRSYNSDTEDARCVFKYRKVKPKLPKHSDQIGPHVDWVG